MKIGMRIALVDPRVERDIKRQDDFWFWLGFLLNYIALTMSTMNWKIQASAFFLIGASACFLLGATLYVVDFDRMQGGRYGEWWIESWRIRRTIRRLRHERVLP